MNKKKIHKILSSTISGLYLINTTSVFAHETTPGVSIEANTNIDTSQTESNVEQDTNYSDKESDDESNKESNEDFDDGLYEDSEENAIDNDLEISNEESNNTNSDSEKLDEILDNKIETDESMIVDDNLSSIENNECTEDESNNSTISSDNLKNVTTKITSSSQTIHKPSIDYLDGFIELKDNGLIVSSSKVEDFNSSENLEFNFSNSAWTISDGNLVSNKIGHSLSTTNSITLELENEATITIKAKVSSEKNYDWGRIYINGAEVFKQSGTTNNSYTTITQKLNSGTNTIEFKYEKDGSTDSGLDAMLIGEIRVASDVIVPNSEKLEYRLNGGDWTEYVGVFPCEDGDLVEARAYYNLGYSDIESIKLDIVNILDSNLKKELNNILSKDIDNNLFLKSDLESLDTLNIANKDISDLSGLEHAINLTTLTANNNRISDISVIDKMPKLEKINFLKNNIQDESAIDSISSKNNLTEVKVSLDIPDYELNIGENDYFNNIPVIYLDHSNIKNININNANSLKTFSTCNAKIGNVNISECSSLNSVYLNNSNLNDVLIKDIVDSSSFNFSMSNGTLISLEISNCKNIGYIATQDSIMDSIVLESLAPSQNNSISFNLDDMCSKRVNISNILSDSFHSLFYSSGKSDDVFIENANFSTMSFSNSYFENIQLENVQTKDMGLYSFETKSDLDLTGSIIQNISSNNMKVKSLKVVSCPNLTYASLYGLVAESLVIDDCPKLGSTYLPNAKITDIYINNLPTTKTLCIDGAISENVIVENCSNLTKFTSYSINKGNIKNLTLCNLNKMTEVNFANYNIENISISDLNSVTDINLSNNNITDIYQIKSLNTLTDLNISNNSITDISPLKNITSLNVDNINALNQSIELGDIIVKEGIVEIDSPIILDYEGNSVAATEVSDKSKTDSNKIVLGEYTEGVYDKVIKFESETSKYSVNVSQKINVDGTAPELNITPNVNEWTNKNISLKIVAHDELSGLDYIKLPNGDIVKDSTYSIEVEINGSYEFEAVDMVGNFIKKTITVSNIDKENPVIETSVTYNDDNTEATIKVEATDSLSGVSMIVLPSGEVVEDATAFYSVTKNGNYSVAVIDVAGNIQIQTISIDEIKNIVDSDDNMNNGTGNDSDNDEDKNDTEDKDDSENNVDKDEDKNNNDNENENNKPTDNITNNNDNNSNNESNLNKIPNASGFGIFAPIIALISLSIGAESLKKRK